MTNEELAAEVLEELDRRIERGEGDTAFFVAVRPALHHFAEHDPAFFASTVREILDELGFDYGDA